MKYVVCYTESEVAVYALTQQSGLATLAASEGATQVPVKSKRDLSDIPTSVLVRLFNASADQPVTRFKDRATAESRVFGCYRVWLYRLSHQLRLKGHRRRQARS
jgi:hypothetical protein